VGLDYSRAFVNAGIALQEKGVLPYKYATEGRLLASSTAEVAPDIDRARVNFMHGDACGLPKTFGAYDAVLLANLLDRLPAPRYESNHARTHARTHSSFVGLRVSCRAGCGE
jgi:hypothetical protein